MAVDIGASAPATREEIQAVLGKPRTVEGYALRKQIAEWLADDVDGAKAAWLKGT